MSNVTRRDLIKGMAVGVGAALLPGSETPRLTKAAVDDVGTLAATPAAVPEPKLEMGEAEWFSPTVLHSEVSVEENLRDLYEIGTNGPVGVTRGLQTIRGEFEMYLDGGKDAMYLQKCLDKQEKINLELDQHGFQYHFQCYIEEVVINARPAELMTAQVKFRALDMEVAEL